MNDLKELSEKLDWLIIHLRVTQALCEIILENLPEKNKKELISLMHDRVKQID